MKLQLLYLPTYLSVIKNSQGSKAFRHFYSLAEGKKKDILKDGRASCAYFVSSILHNFKLIKTPHTTVGGLLKDMAGSGWTLVDHPMPGAVLVWGKDGRPTHIGFCLYPRKAISNSSRLRYPVCHNSARLETGENLLSVYSHSFLSPKDDVVAGIVQEICRKK